MPDKNTQSPSFGIKPNFFIIGAPKGGTTAIAHYLSEHPNVFMCAPKEPFFWGTDQGKVREVHALHSVEDYLRLFESADLRKHKAIGEGSTTYLQSKEAIQNIVNFQSEAKFIVMLRNPVEVAHGMHGELRRHFAEDEPDFEKAWHLQEDRKIGRNIPRNDKFSFQLQYREVATFAPQLQRLFALVPESHRHIIIFDDFVRKTQDCYCETLRFLGLPDDRRTEFPKVNQAGKYRMPIIGRLYQAPPSWLQGPIKIFRRWYQKQNGPLRRVVFGLVQKKAPRESLSRDFEEHLKGVFRADIVATSALLGRDLSKWTQES